ncbi:DUF862-domain-containing protein [Nadsonia fulvescens var. elongata DSM 6958]|uniref:DUF862-domain-containing protein n=1 Tax=Nadsonia fulvescens var. elongata DSM 6958 TaxID=857566 RepID=A0A1E3PQT1_9ASCO|nr:DUF862-domain-containing protein [Nadsonia fulvescens var. elongata DSM 6958]
MSQQNTDANYNVKLHVYDLSRGLASQMGLGMVGFQVDGIWHSGVVYNDEVEIYYGNGIQISSSGQTHHGIPLRIIDIGETSVPRDVLKDYLEELQEKYSHNTYNLFENNCNHFSQELVSFLTGKDIPEDVSGLAAKILATPFGQMIRPMIEQTLKPMVMGATQNKIVL